MKPKSTPDPASLRERALAYLARREHSRFELTRKLEAAGFAVEEIAPVLDAFEARDWLSDQRFAEGYVTAHQACTGYIKLIHDLRGRGVSEEIIKATLGTTSPNEHERAVELWRKKFGGLPRDTTEYSKQVRYLAGRGFTYEVIRNVLNNNLY
jgi:regulatory protein